MSLKLKIQQEQREIISIMQAQVDVFNTVMNNNGELSFNKPLFINSLKIKKIRAVPFTEKIDIRTCEENEWNEYVGRIHKAIGIESYCVWVHDLNNRDMIGIMAFYMPDNTEIKMKHFIKWRELLEKINYQLGPKESDVCCATFDAFKALLDNREYEKAKDLMVTYLNDDTKSPSDIKTVLVITKSFKTNEHMGETRKKLVAKLEAMLGQKLV